MNSQEQLKTEDEDPLFQAIQVHTRSRRRTREVIADIRRRGYVMVAENELRALRERAMGPADERIAREITAAVLASQER